jgi:hypothetical protein
VGLHDRLFLAHFLTVVEKLSNLLLLSLHTHPTTLIRTLYIADAALFDWMPNAINIHFPMR